MSSLLEQEICIESTLSSIPSRVEFIDVHDQYTFNEDLVCKYCLIDYEIQEGDRIAIFKLGWQYIKDYVLFEWAPKNVDNFVVFNKHSLPKSTTDIYQFCFISGENNVHGASEPFQFIEKLKLGQSILRYTSCKIDNSLTDNYKALSNPSSSINIPDVIEKDRETLRLKEENEFLRNTLKLLVNKHGKDYTADVENLKKTTADFQLMLANQQNQIKDLQLQISSWSVHYKALQKERDNLESTCKDLKKNFQKNLNFNTDVEIGELESMPPFPFAK